MFSQTAGGLERLVAAAFFVEMDERHMIGREIHVLEK
jgi:hypothetical protein